MRGFMRIFAHKYKFIKELVSMTDKVDRLDLKILKIISGNARIAFKDIADVCGVSRAAVHQRVLRLLESGVVQGSGYHVNPRRVGYKTCTYVGIKLERGSMYKDVVVQLEKIPEIVECHFTTGPYTMFIKLYCRDNEHLMCLLNTNIQEIPGVISTEALISLEQSINREVPILLPEEEEDDDSAVEKASRRSRLRDTTDPV